MDLYGVVGAGGFGREVLPVAHEFLTASLGNNKFKLVFVDDDNTVPKELNGCPVMSTAAFLSHSIAGKKINVAIADYCVREKLSETLIVNGAVPFSIVSKNSIRLAGNEIGEGAILCPFTTITSNAKIGRFFHANIYSYVAHDCVIGDFVTFAPRVHCNGHVIIEDYAYIGTGAIIKQGSADAPLIIGEGAVVGMGAVVNRNVPPFTVVAGNPAKRIAMAKKD